MNYIIAVQVSHHSVIPAIFWRESTTTEELDARLRGHDSFDISK